MEKEVVVNKCKHCNKEFKRPKIYFKYSQNKGKYCSRLCANLGNMKGSRAERGVKICSTCKIKKNIKEFYKNKIMYDGYQSQCIVCTEDKRCNKKYGVDSKFRKNKGCEICGLSKRKFVIDHDHKTNKTRGILCLNCNLALGLLGDSIEKLKVAIEYIEKYEKK